MVVMMTMTISQAYLLVDAVAEKLLHLRFGEGHRLHICAAAGAGAGAGAGGGGGGGAGFLACEDSIPAGGVHGVIAEGFCGWGVWAWI